ncbi:phage tail protein [Pseudoduganella sp. SL102]|uniref:phage tail protein n=1 Tax=Pseudoduganella sp. SL102 TaxID=2995154 RepID=UPI00248CC695|nr:phage tail protein [Pseudoduganella sp. SL102]WBR99992.1 phage tail protein [Pseudoduganella sp. SL102]
MSTTSNPPVPLYERLPEIYRTRDAEQEPANQLRAYLAAVEGPFGALHADIAQLYEDLFIDTCDDWVIPYVADLLGTSHLQGDPRTLRADVADTIALRRRKGTLGAIERLAANLTGWACRCVELRENLGWSQHLNHQRPDAGGRPPYADPALTRFHIPRGGTAPLRDPAALSLLGTPFDTFAYTADVKAAQADVRHVNLPNLAIFLWRLAAYRLPPVRPLAQPVVDLTPAPAGTASFALRFDLHPLDLPVQLFNTARPGPALSGGTAAPLTAPDAVPGPILAARLDSGTPAGHPEAYVAVDFFNAAGTPPDGFDLADVGLHLFMPETLEALLVPVPPATEWRWLVRGDNLCAWETGLRRPLRGGEIVVDPRIGRVLVGLDTATQADELIVLDGGQAVSRMFASFTYGAAGPVGAHPVPRRAAPSPVLADLRTVGAVPGGITLQAALDNLDIATAPVIIEIADSLVHDIDLALVPGTAIDGTESLRLANDLTIRAASGQRPIIRLAQPLSLRPVVAGDATPDTPAVRLEGLYLAPGAAFPAGAALVDRAAVARLEILGCTLAPGGHGLRDGSRAAMQPALRLENGYGFADPGDEDDFVPTPDIVIQRSVTGSIAVDERYRLTIADSIVDAGLGFGDAPAGVLAIGAATDPTTGWGARLDFDGLTCFGAARVAAVGGLGGIFSQRFEVLDNQHGCIKWTAFSDDADRLPPHHYCVHAPDARIVFTSERFNDPGYGQLARATDRRVRELGPGDDAMGAFGFLLEAHKWANLQIRLREFMPVGVRPLVLQVT